MLARLTDVDVPESRQSLSDRLSQWLGWADAIELSAALSGNPPAVASGAQPEPSAAPRSAVAHVSEPRWPDAIAGDGALAPARRRGQAQPPAQADAVDAVVDYAVYRQRYLSVQQAMETGIGNLRGRLRSMLAASTPAMSRLAVLDAAMERALSARERSRLPPMPALLEGHFERLRQAGQAALADAQVPGEPAAVTPGAWLDVFRKDMRSVLLAELDIRFQPVEGLLAALRSS
ncbi:DUF3348 domain-containing protein [Cupriavidus basilensis]